MALIAPKQVVLDAYKHCAIKGLLDKDYILAKLQGLVLETELTQEEIQPIVDILIPLK